MEPVEINAGAWYLRGVASDGGYRWDVCEPITGDVAAVVTLDPETGVLSSVGTDAEAMEVAKRAVRGFARQALGITIED